MKNHSSILHKIRVMDFTQDLSNFSHKNLYVDPNNCVNFVWNVCKIHVKFLTVQNLEWYFPNVNEIPIIWHDTTELFETPSN